MIQGWQYYKHVMTPTTLPHEIPLLKEMENPEFWRHGGGYCLISSLDNRFQCGNRNTMVEYNQRYAF